MNGGLAGLFWSLIWTTIGQFFVVLSLAEMASMAPTASGQSHWVSEFAPRKYQRYLSYCSGWMTSISWQSIIAVDCYIISDIIQALMVVNNPTYSPKQWAGTLFTILTVIVVAAFNTFAASHLPFAEGVFATCRVFAFVPIIVTLWVMVSPKMSAAEVFVHFKDHTHTWPSTGVSVLVGQITCMFTTFGSDAVAHLAEEVEDAAVVVPQGMVWSYLLVCLSKAFCSLHLADDIDKQQSVPLTFIMMITYCFNIGSVDEAINATYSFGTSRNRLWKELQLNHSGFSLRLRKCGEDAKRHNSVYCCYLDPSRLHHNQRSRVDLTANICICVSKARLIAANFADHAQSRQRPALLPLDQTSISTLPDPSQLYPGQRHLHVCAVLDQSRKQSRLQCSTLACDSRSYGDIYPFDRLCHMQTDSERTTATSSLAARQGWNDNQSARLVLRHLVLLLVFLACEV